MFRASFKIQILWTLFTVTKMKYGKLFDGNVEWDWISAMILPQIATVETPSVKVVNNPVSLRLLEDTWILRKIRIITLLFKQLYCLSTCTERSCFKCCKQYIKPYIVWHNGCIEAKWNIAPFYAIINLKHPPWQWKQL